jgi:hypothetical protein
MGSYHIFICFINYLILYAVFWFLCLLYRLLFSFFLSNIWVFSVPQLPIQFITSTGLLLALPIYNSPFQYYRIYFTQLPLIPLTCSCPPFHVSVNICYHEAYHSTLKVEAAGSFEMLVNIYHTIWHHNTEDSNLHYQCHLKLTSHIIYFTLFATSSSSPLSASRFNFGGPDNLSTYTVNYSKTLVIQNII